MGGIVGVLGLLELMIIRLDERSGLTATKADVANVRTDLATKATHGTVWSMGFTVSGLFIAALAVEASTCPTWPPCFAGPVSRPFPPPPVQARRLWRKER